MVWEPATFRQWWGITSSPQDLWILWHDCTSNMERRAALEGWAASGQTAPPVLPSHFPTRDAPA